MATDSNEDIQSSLIKGKNIKVSKNTTSGFRSGFLLGKKDQTKRKKTARKEKITPTELAILTNGNAKEALLAATDKYTKKTNEESFVPSIKERKTKLVSRDLMCFDEHFEQQNPLMVMPPPAKNQGGGEEPMNSSKSQFVAVFLQEKVGEPSKPLIEELSSTPITNQSHFPCTKNQGKETLRDVSRGPEYPAEHDREVNRKESSNERPNVNELSWLQFMQALECFLWSAGKEPCDNSGFLFLPKDWTLQQVGWTWGRILEEQVKFHDRFIPLLFSLLQYPNTLVSFLQPQSQTDREISLNLLRILKFFLRHHEAKSIKWPIAVLDALTLLCWKKHRTVLAQEAWTTAIFILALKSESNILQATNGKDLKSFQISAIEACFRKLILTKLSWLQSKKKSTKKHKIETAILKDWKRINSVFGEDNPAVWFSQLCDTFGGVRQTLCCDSASSQANIILLIEALISCLRNRLGPGGDPHELQKRRVVRGLLAVSASVQHSNDQTREIADLLLNLRPTCLCSDTVNLTTSLQSILRSDIEGLPSGIISEIAGYE